MTPATIHRIWQADVNRWHHSIDHRLRNSGDTIQSHQCRVAQLLVLLFPGSTADDIKLALFHDAPESWTGDPSYEAKKDVELCMAHNSAELFNARRLGLPHGSHPRVKLCDGLDCILWANSRAPDIMAGDGWPRHIATVKQDAWALGVGAQIEGMMQAAGVQ